MRSDDEIQAALSELATNRPQTNTVKVVERFVSRIYGAKKNQYINEHRFEIIQRTYGKTNEKEVHRREHCSSLFKRAAPTHKYVSFVVRMWASAHTATLEKAPLVKDGWEIEESRYRIIWFQGNQLPEVLDPKLTVPEVNGDETEADEEDDETANNYDMDEQMNWKQ